MSARGDSIGAVEFPRVGGGWVGGYDGLSPVLPRRVLFASPRWVVRLIGVGNIAGGVGYSHAFYVYLFIWFLVFGISFGFVFVVSLFCCFLVFMFFLVFFLVFFLPFFQRRSNARRGRACAVGRRSGCGVT